MRIPVDAGPVWVKRDNRRYRGRLALGQGDPRWGKRGYLGDRTVADAILDRLVHNSYRLVLKGKSMRRHKGLTATPATPSRAKGR